MKGSKGVDITELVDQLGGFGRFQLWIFVLCCYACVLPGILVVNNFFLSYQPPYRCIVPQCEFTNTSYYKKDFLNFTTPYDDVKERWDTCHTFTHTSAPSVSGSTCDRESFNVDVKKNCTQYVYDTSIFTSTTVTEFGLVCERFWLQPTSSSMFMVGMLVGAILLGDIADRIGRKKGLVLSSIILLVGGVMCTFAYNYLIFVASRFILGAGGVAVFQVAFILVLEYVPPNWRTFVGIMMEVPFALGEASAALFAFFIRDWRWQQLAVTLSSLVLLAYWWILPESLRWLISKGQLEEAKIILKRIENWNNINISKDVYEALDNENEISVSIVGESSPTEQYDYADDKEQLTEKDRNIFELLRYPNTRSRTLNLMFSWAAVTLVYYGLSANSAKLGGNIFLSFAAIMLIEIPSYLFACFVLDRMGRKGTLCFVMLLGGIASILCGITPADMRWLAITFSMIGKFGIAAGFSVLFIYTVEIYPTSYRSLGLGVCSMSARIGGTLAPFISNMDAIYTPLPLFIFGTLAITSGLLTVFLPETLNTELPQTLEESENLGEDQSPFFFSCCRTKKKLEICNVSNDNPKVAFA